MEVSGQLYGPVALLSAKLDRYPSNKGNVGSKSRYESFVEEKNSLPPPGFEPRPVQPLA